MSLRLTNDCSHEETDDPLYTDRRNFYKDEIRKWTDWAMCV